MMSFYDLWYLETKAPINWKIDTWVSSFFNLAANINKSQSVKQWQSKTTLLIITVNFRKIASQLKLRAFEI